MAPLQKLPELSLSYETKESATSGKFWRWFLAGTLVSVFITSVMVGVTVVYVHTELDSVKDQLRTHDNRLAWLEDTSSNPDGVRINDPTWYNAQLRKRREQNPPESTDHFTKPNGSCLCRDGRDGRDGTPGTDGRDGSQGVKGEKGDMGIDVDQVTRGIVGPRRLKRDADDEPLQELGAHDVYPNYRPSGGDTYVRWGRITCRDDTELVYAGTAAGSHYTHKGGSTDFFCLPTEPHWAASFNAGLNSQSYLYGVEYELPAFDPFSHENAEFLNQRDVPCAVCRLIDRGTKLLLPAMLGCPNSNWTEEYRGFLMSGRHNHEQRSRAVCVDEAPEAIPGSQNSVDGALLHIIEAQCGSLLCPPYVQGREITCTVCSI